MPTKVRVARIRGQQLLLAPWGLAGALLLRLLRPFLLVRLHPLFASRLGHFAANTELYLCERVKGIGAPAQRHVDISFCLGTPANAQLERMWRRVLTLWPTWLLEPILWMNRRLPGSAQYEVGANTQQDRDVHDLFSQLPPWLTFTPEEEAFGERQLRAMGIPPGADFVCLIGRDSAYLKTLAPGSVFDYHAYRNVEIRHYAQAAEALAESGCYVIRMGSVVETSLESTSSKVIDYATSGSRSDFMDVYLPAKCHFCLSCGTGLDAIAYVFRRPIAFSNMVPAGYWYTFAAGSVGIFKHHRLASTGRALSLREIFERGVGFSLRASEFEERGVELAENSPQEIRDVALEMHHRLKGTWQPHESDDALQRRFWAIYSAHATDTVRGNPLHGVIRARFGAVFLRQHCDWLA